MLGEKMLTMPIVIREGEWPGRRKFADECRFNDAAGWHGANSLGKHVANSAMGFIPSIHKPITW